MCLGSRGVLVDGEFFMQKIQNYSNNTIKKYLHMMQFTIQGEKVIFLFNTYLITKFTNIFLINLASVKLKKYLY